jgi:putative hydrolase
VEVDPGWLAQSLKRAVDEVRSGRADYRGFGWIFLLMTPEQRAMVRQMQAMMSLLEGHGNYVMDEVSRGRVKHADAFRRTLHARRNKAGVERAFQKAIGFDVKVRQYAQGEWFVAEVVRNAGMDVFNRVWEKAENLPTMEEIARPQDWVARVGAS